MTALNGWTAEKLWDLKQKLDATHDKVLVIEGDIVEVKVTLKAMQSDETESLKEQLKELQRRPQRQIAAIVVPFICACIPAAVLLLSHA